MSVLVSTVDQPTLNSLLRKQFGMEPVVGIGLLIYSTVRRSNSVQIKLLRPFLNRIIDFIGANQVQELFSHLSPI